MSSFWRTVILILIVQILLLKFVHGSEVTDKRVIRTYEAEISWYDKSYNRLKQTASGEKFNKNKLTVAHKYLPFGTIIRITNLENNKSVICRVNDRGPYVKNREYDVTKRIADTLDISKIGIARVVIEILS